MGSIPGWELRSCNLRNTAKKEWKTSLNYILKRSRKDGSNPKAHKDSLLLASYLGAFEPLGTYLLPCVVSRIMPPSFPMCVHARTHTQPVYSHGRALKSKDTLLSGVRGRCDYGRTEGRYTADSEDRGRGYELMGGL